MDNLPVFELSDSCINNFSFINDLIKSLHTTGILIVKVPSLNQSHNDSFLDLMEKYYEQPNYIKMNDSRPELSYQVGVTPENTEISTCSQDPKCLENLDLSMSNENKPIIHFSTDPKWRYMWNINFNSEKNVIPEAFKDCWQKTMDNWGNNLLDVIIKVTFLLEKGLGLIEGSLVSRLCGGKHLLAPTGVDVLTYNKLNTVYASYHKDISFFTIHGKSRFPGLYVWTRDAKKIPVKIPDGCLLLQVGEQLEWLTGGFFYSGFHEVICDENTLKALENAQINSKSTWRVSSTVFSHVDQNKYLEPLIKPSNNKQYPKITAGEYLSNELKKIKLGR
jgi:isopenicillin N synthase-like dioxygenase